jgi:adenosyl cobinamide kinase/adenosyl cobinamide phosphate guanylyltransferase
MNLMMNSIDAMKDLDGTRELSIQSQRGENGQVLISVSDTGRGLPPQKAEQRLAWKRKAWLRRKLAASIHSIKLKFSGSSRFSIPTWR